MSLLTLQPTRMMQTCFREHPDIYGSELEDEEDQNAPPAPDAPTPASAPALTSLPDSPAEPIPAAATSASTEPQTLAPSPSPDSGAGSSDTERTQAAKEQVVRDHGNFTSESDKLVPKAAHDATGAAVDGK